MPHPPDFPPPGLFLQADGVVRPIMPDRLRRLRCGADADRWIHTHRCPGRSC